MNLLSLDDWLTHIESFNPKEIELGLSRVNKVAQCLGIFPLSSKSILVAGTNGKGSCVAMLESIALQQGKSVVCYTSPHLLSFNERIRLNGKNVSDQDLIDAFQAIETKRQDIPLTFFEFTTLAALLIFKKQQPELIILEVGLGGRQDATNIIEPDVSVITTVAMDHTDWLGDSLEAIAYEKGGIIRQGKSALVGDTKTFKLLNKVLPEFSNELLLAESNISSLTQLLGDSKVNPYCLLQQNLLLAKLAFEKCFHCAIDKADFIESLASISLQGRFQRVEGLGACIIVDVAHNPQSTENLFQQLEQYMSTKSIKRVTAILGMMADKSVSEVINILDPLINDWCFVDLDNQRAMSSKALNELYQKQDYPLKSKGYSFVSVKVAYQWLAQQKHFSDPDQLLVVFGSFITVANMLQYAEEAKR